MNGNFDNTYKIAWAKSLVELSSSINISDDGPIIFSFEQIADCCFKYYGQRGLHCFKLLDIFLWGQVQ